MKDYIFSWVKNIKTGEQKDITLKRVYKAMETKDKFAMLIDLAAIIGAGLELAKILFVSGAKAYSQAEYEIYTELGLIHNDAK